MQHVSTIRVGQAELGVVQEETEQAVSCQLIIFLLAADQVDGEGRFVWLLTDLRLKFLLHEHYVWIGTVLYQQFEECVDSALL